MKTLKYFIFVLLINNAHSQILNVPEVFQEQDNWCWAGVSKCIFEYYGYAVEQCQIAEYARQVSTWHDFGDVDCCQDATLGCNYWNYAWGCEGSIQDILVYFDSIQNDGFSSYLSQADIRFELSAGRPFVIRWGWYSGGGHFVVGHGIKNNYLHYMDPWFGEGLHISRYNWVVDDGNHEWTHTNVLTTNPSYETVVECLDSKMPILIYPNPAKDKIMIESNLDITLIFYDISGKKVLSQNANGQTDINISRLSKGVYFINIISEDKIIGNSKIVKL